jgi:ABC-type phosphate/phosphonate transport system substrate-binding protein
LHTASVTNDGEQDLSEDHISGAPTRRQFCTWLAAATAVLAAARVGLGQTSARPIGTRTISAQPDSEHPLLVAVSVETLAGANVTDARAAYKVWIKEIATTLGISSMQTVPEVFVPSDEIVRLIRHGDIDLFGITAAEYAKVVEFVDPSSLLVEDYLSNGMEYVLVVHNASPFKKLSDLRGTHLAIHTHRDMNLAPAWIGNLLAADNLPRMDSFFGEQAAHGSVTQVVLPVFFRRMDAACLARRYFETAVELNPQLGKDLHALATSPKVVPIALCFHKHCTPEAEQLLKDAIGRSAKLPAFQQIAALYQSRVLVSRPSSCMNVTLDMLHQYARVGSRTLGPQKEHL